MAHARRKIHDLHVRKATVTTTAALRRIGELYAIEERIRGKTPGERRRVRQERARPLLDDFDQWSRDRLLTLSTQSDTTKAINYMLNQWRVLVYYCDDGLAEIDNNIAENALRCMALGRKNFVFLAADSGGERAVAGLARITAQSDRPLSVRGSAHQSQDGDAVTLTNGLYKAELIHRRAPWKSREAVELATLEWMSWFNHHRLLGWNRSAIYRQRKLRQTTTSN